MYVCVVNDYKLGGQCGQKSGKVKKRRATKK